jgi:hypothetical protein
LRFPRRLLVLFTCASPLCAQTDLRPGSTQSARAEQVTKSTDELPNAPSTPSLEGPLQRLFTCLLLFGFSIVVVSLRAQDSTTGTSGNASLPEAPSVSVERSTGVSGTVLDPSGAVVSGADVTLTRVGESQGRAFVTGADGKFAFNGLPPGPYVIQVKANGFQPATSATFTITAGQAYEMPSVTLSIMSATTAVVVQPTEVIAAQQIKAEEKQRVLGVIPDFYTSYVWNPAPLNTKQKFSMALRDTFDPVTFVGVSLSAGIQQARNNFPGYGQGAEGYAKRWGAQFANGRSSDILSRAVFPSLFHQDPRYFYQGSGSTWSRISHAVSYAFVARSDSGHLMPNYSYFLGDLSSAALSNLYYPASSRGVGLVFSTAGIGLAGRAGQDLVREFIFKHITKNVPASGKPASNERNP